MSAPPFGYSLASSPPDSPSAGYMHHPPSVKSKRSFKGTVGIYDMSSEDGLNNRIRDLNSREERWKAFRDGDLRNHTGETNAMQITSLETCEWTLRIFAYMLTFGGALPRLFSALMDKFHWVVAIIFSGLLLSVKDNFNDLWNATPIPDRPEYHWAGTLVVLVIFVAFMELINLLQWLYETQGDEVSTRRRRLNRVRFRQLEAQQRDIDRMSRSFAFLYNDIDDPDIAITVFRNAEIQRTQYSNLLEYMYSALTPPTASFKLVE